MKSNVSYSLGGRGKSGTIKYKLLLDVCFISLNKRFIVIKSSFPFVL